MSKRHPKFDTVPRANPTRRKRKRKSPRKMTALQLKYFGPKKARRNPIRTKEGRVLRVEGHNKRESSALLLKRKKQKAQHKRRTRRKGTLTYQTAEYVLRRGPKGTRVSGTSKAREPSGRGRSSRGEHDFFQWASDTFGR